MYLIQKSIKTKTTLFLGVTAKLVIVEIFAFAAPVLFSALVHPFLMIPFRIFLMVLAFFLITNSKYNVNYETWNSFLFFINRPKEAFSSLHSISYEEGDQYVKKINKQRTHK